MADYTNILKKVLKYQQKFRIKGVSIALVNSSKTLLSYQNGFADFYGERKVEDTTKFMIGSITKVLTAISIMQLVEGGLLDLDADIKEYIPEFTIKNRFDTSKISIRNLLNHRSGLPCDDFGILLSEKQQDYNQIIDYLADQYLIAPPGKMFAYSNLGYTLLGIIIERVSKKKYVDYIQKNIFNPMGIDGNFICTPEEFRQHKYEVSRSYNSLGEEKIDLLSSLLPAGSNTYISAFDVAKIAQMFLNKGKFGNKKILQQSSVEEMLSRPNFNDEEGMKIGLGLMFDKYYLANVGEIIGHSGGTIYHHSEMLFLPNSDLAIVILTNSTNGESFINKIIIPLLENALSDQGYKKERKERVKKNYRTFKVEEYTGVYPTAFGPIYITYKKQLRFKMGILRAKMFLKNDGWFDLKPTGLSILFGRQIRNRQIKIEKELLSIKMKRNNEQYVIGTIGVFVKPFDIFPTWSVACGRYACISDPKRSIAGSLNIFVKNRFLTVRLSGGLKKHAINLLGTIDEKEAIILGYGRGTSETIFLSNKMIIFMGNIFVKESICKTFFRRIGLIKLLNNIKNIFRKRGFKENDKE